jgi:hypothetical protein
MSTAKIVQTEDGLALDMPCPRKIGYCNHRPPVHRGDSYVDEKRGRVWQWIGPEDAPTIRPSVGCDAKCGQHRIITDGKF